MSASGKIRQKRNELRKRRAAEVDETSPFATPPRSPESPMNEGSSSSTNKDGLKIKIKLQQQQQPHTTATPRVGLLAFDTLLELRASIANYAHHAGDWTDAMYAGLRTQLEGAKATISFIQGEVSQHLQVLEAWKPSSQEESSSSKRKLDGEKKGKKRRAHEIGENDSSYSSYSSPEEAEVDVDGDEGVDVDVEAIDGDDSQVGEAEEATKEEEYTPKVKVSRGGNRNRAARDILKRFRGGNRRQKYLKNLVANNAAGAAGGGGGGVPHPHPRRHKAEIPPAASPVEYDAGVASSGASGMLSSEEEEEDTTVAQQALGPNAFWTAMEPYLRPITDHDLAYITPKPPRPDDPIYTIPPLGPHYSQVWATDEGLGSPPPARQSLRSIKGEGGAEFDYPEDEDADPIMGDMTQRILQSLIDENIIMNRPPSPFSDETVINPNIDENNKEALPHHGIPVIPVASYSRQNMINLEERIRMELRAIGLLDDDEIDPSEREDDEVCAELRLLQSKLREQISINNERRQKLIALVKPKMREQEEARKQKLINQQIEKNFSKLIQRKKKRGGRRAPPPQVGT